MKDGVRRISDHLLKSKASKTLPVNPVHEKVEQKKKELQKRMRIPKILFSVLFAAMFIVLTKTKMFPILGTDFNFSMGVMFGPALGGLLGVNLGIATILGSQLVGTAIGLYKLKDTLSLLIFFPILIGSIYFSRSFRGDRRLLAIPAACIVLFLLHPIGLQVWYFSLFWLVPMAIISFKDRIDNALRHPVARTYSYSLGTAFVDHSVGSVVYLWFLAIPAEFWIAAIPLVVIERLLIALGITFSFHSVKAAMKALQEVAVAVANAGRESSRDSAGGMGIPVPAE
ncbi:MAG: hypothetical protein JXC85_01470 [Candidatus Aenigmarchaeota archaeon]|nr:hypothetical protein [Candidatus Aenigmarchaeota archaeon]